MKPLSGLRPFAPTLVVCLLLFWCDRAHAVVIDGFSTGAIEVTATNVTGTTQLQGGLDTAAVVGGKRRWTVQAYSIVGPNPLATATVDVSLGQLRLESTTSNNGSLRLDYGADNDQLAVDLTAGGHDRLRIGFSELPSDPAKILDFWVSVSTIGPGNSSSGRSFRDEVRGLGTHGTLDVPYSLLPFPTFSDIDVLGLTLSIAADTKVVIGEIRTVPEPTAAPFLIMAVAVIARRQKKVGFRR